MTKLDIIGILFKKLLSISKQAGRRLPNEQKMIGLIMSGSNWTEDSAHLACSQAATMNEDDFILDEITDQVVAKKKLDFMKKVKDCLNKSDKLQLERLDEMKRLILDQMKKTIRRKLEARGEKMGSDEAADDSNAQSKARVKSPPKL